MRAAPPARPGEVVRKVGVRAAVVAVAGLLGACGGDDERRELTISAASSLQGALTKCAGDDVRLQFAGSDELAAQIRKGLVPDVYAAANTKLPEQLAAEGLLERPRTFATNQLVLALPRDSRIARLEDLGERGVKVVVGSESVPVGDYTREVLARVPGRIAGAIIANVRSEEPDVKGIVGKLTQGAADAGFVYRTDVTAAGDRLRAVTLPEELEPQVAYGAGVVKATKRRADARAFLESLRAGACSQALGDAGFGPAP